MTLTGRARERIREIHRLSLEYNRKLKKNHRKKLLELARKHIDEIEVLYGRNDPHADIEAGDLLVLCMELMLESGKSPDGIIEECFARYERKLFELSSCS